MLSALQFIATLTATLFAGAALYINIAEHPARMSLDTKMAAMQWAPSYKRAAWLQAPLAVVSFISGVLVWVINGELAWLIASLLIGAVVPFTFLVAMPVNRKLLDPNRDLTSAETRDLLDKWNKLHSARTVLSLAASALYLLSLSQA
jgi:uncharacterized membrane protein